MRILVNGATLTVERFKHSPHIGALLTPRCNNSPSRIIRWGIPFGIDNGAASDAGFEADMFLKLLGKVISCGAAHACLFVAAPDVVKVVDGEFIGDAKATVEKFYKWAPMIRDIGFKVALVGQDGLEKIEIPWHLMDAYFNGGSTEWKLGAGADIGLEAKHRGLHVHWGRVNSRRRIRAGIEMGADSIDGSHFTRWPDTHIPVGIRWVESELKRERLFGYRRSA